MTRYPALAAILLLCLAGSVFVARPALSKLSARKNQQQRQVPPDPEANKPVSNTRSRKARRVPYDSPMDLCFSADGGLAYVVDQTSNAVLVVDVISRKKVGEIEVDWHPVQVAISPDGKRLFVSCLYANNVVEIDTRTQAAIRRITTGYAPYGLAVSPDGTRLYVANSISNTISFIDTDSGETLRDLPVTRDPRFLALTADGAILMVSNGSSRGVTRIDTEAGKVVSFQRLGEAALLREIRCAHSGQWAFVTHLVSRDLQITTQMEFGQIHSNGFSAVSLEEDGRWVTLLLDSVFKGAANPWGTAIAADDSRLYVSIAGTHEIALIDLARALQLVKRTPQEEVNRLAHDLHIMEREGILRKVPAGGIGPRGMELNELRDELWVCNYFSETLSVLDASSGALKGRVRLGPQKAMAPRRKGEMLFNDARLCFQEWFSCASCHQEDAITDALNWDLLNDGAGNSKNNKSLYDVHDTAPAMWAGVRKEMSVAVGAGQLFLGALPRPENHQALLAFIGSLEHQPNPFREHPTAASRRGEKLFSAARCQICHQAPLLTDLKKHDIGLRGEDDLRTRFDTPSLRDCLRTAPYLHDGRAETLKEIFTKHNKKRLHGNVDGFTDQDFDDLVAYLKTL